MDRRWDQDSFTRLLSTVSPQMQPHMKHIAVKYRHFRSFIANIDVEIKHVDTKEQITDIFTKPLDSELFGYLLYNINGWYLNSIFLCEVV